jgi:hypothetical protein
MCVYVVLYEFKVLLSVYIGCGLRERMRWEFCLLLFHTPLHYGKVYEEFVILLPHRRGSSMIQDVLLYRESW